MQQKHRIVLLLFALSAACQALPMTPESLSELEGVKIFKSETSLNNTANFTFKKEGTPALVNNSSNLKHPADESHETLKTLAIESNTISLDEANNFNGDNFEIVTEKFHQTSELYKDFENDFKLLENRMPDLTEEECREIQRVGATPWNFLKKTKTNQTNKTTTDRMQYLTPVFVTIPIVINSQTSLPLSLIVGGQNIALKLPTVEKMPDLNAAHGKISSTNSSDSIVNNRVKENNNTLARQTNRHRSNFHKKEDLRH